MAAEAPQVTSIKMTDGKVVDFPGKRKLVKTSDETTRSIRLDFINGETRTFTIPDALFLKFALHGGEQKLGDETAGVEDVEDAVLAVDSLIDRLNAGEWSMKRESSGIAGTSVLVRALVEHYQQLGKPRPVEAIREYLKEKTQAEKMALRQSAKLKPIVDRLEAEKASKAAKVDTDAMLAELEAATA